MPNIQKVQIKNDEKIAYKTGFELYKSADEVEIYIGVNYL